MTLNVHAQTVVRQGLGHLAGLPLWTHHQCISAPEAVDEPDHVASIHVADGRLLGTSRADDIQTPDALVEGDTHRTMLLCGTGGREGGERGGQRNS